MLLTAVSEPDGNDSLFLFHGYMISFTLKFHGHNSTVTVPPLQCVHVLTDLQIFAILLKIDIHVPYTMMHV